MVSVSPDQLVSLQASLLNASGDTPLHNRFRALFTLKSLKSPDAVQIISKGDLPDTAFIIKLTNLLYPGFADDSALLKHELAYCLGQMKLADALPTLEFVLRNTKEDPMVRHEVRIT
jgi:deoxyhypusine monooxygenase